MLEDAANLEPWLGYLVAAGVLLVSLLLLVGLLRWLRTGAKIPPERREDLAIDVAALDSSGPPEAPLQLEYYGIPVRLTVLVLAPVGRYGALPDSDQLAQILEQLLPDLSKVLALHQGVYCRWPNQLSVQGFKHAFFNKLALPGERGKNTPWCSIAGKFSADGQQFLAGMLCCAASANALSEVFVEHEGRWLEVIRVRRRDG